MKQSSLLASLPKETMTVQQYIDDMNNRLRDEVVAIEGELQEVRISKNVWVFFQLKDEQNESVLRCFAVRARLGHVPLEDGMKVVVHGYAKLHEKYGFSLTVERIEPRGEGALQKALLQLQEKLFQEGIFAEERKRPIPRIPEKIALIASEESAAYSDFIKVLNARRGGIVIHTIHTGVQGKEAIPGIVQAIDFISSQGEQYDAMVLTRGGGSLEDLQAFNAEEVVRAVYRSKVPTIVAVGHERDTTLAELAADMRASTPSNAAELISASAQELGGEIRYALRRIRQSVDHTMNSDQQRLRDAIQVSSDFFVRQQQRVRQHIEFIATTAGRIQTMMKAKTELTLRTANGIQKVLQYRLETLRARHHQYRQLLALVDPKAVLKKGYAIVRAETAKPLSSVKGLQKGQSIQTTFSDGQCTSTITSVEQHL